MWTIENGLPQGSVNDMVQTEDGALWIATFGGLVRFDGIEFRTFDFDTLSNLPSVRVTALERDGPNGLWIFTQGGNVLRFRDERIVEELQVPNPNQDVLSLVSLVKSEGGGIYLRGSAGGMWLYEKGAWSRPLGEFQSLGNYTDMCLDSNGRLAFPRDDVLVRLSGDKTIGAELPTPGRITALCAAPMGRLWVGLIDGLAVTKGDSVERVVLDPPLVLSVTALLDDGNDGVWVGSTRGLQHLVLDRATNEWVRGPAPKTPLDTIGVQSLLYDREGN
ncbi:MAG: two-component regulator propeller domain-containing protein [Planctomycetota bacterium]|nr:two-component regulator propeller domain-containing protein [Planctomycetota bacterium]